MSVEDQIKFHSDRAMAELDLALSAPSGAAAEAHFSRSSKHLQWMRSRAGAATPPSPRVQLEPSRSACPAR